MLITAAAMPASAAGAPAYVPQEVVVGYAGRPLPAVRANIATSTGISMSAPGPGTDVQVLRLPHGVSVARAIAGLRREPGIAYAVPNFIAHAAGGWYPNDPGRAHRIHGWAALQWNFLPGFGVNAPAAWANLFAAHRGGGKGVVVAILDTGVAYRNWHQFHKSPDFRGTRFVAPYDFVAGNRYPLDREGHGTFIAGTIGEATNNGFGLTGLAYGASLMPVRVLDQNGTGDAATIARGIRYAVNHRAQVVNLSLEFGIGVTSADIPDILNAIRFAHERGVVVVAASGNEGVNQLAYPARAPSVISVGATTRDRCLAEYSNGGPGLDLVAPGGGQDSSFVSDPDCHPSPGQNLPPIYQMTLLDPPNWRRFGFPGDVFGTSMSTAHVAAAAALVIASGVLGRHPTPDQILARLEATAQPLNGSQPNQTYGYGLLDVGAATAVPATHARRASRRTTARHSRHASRRRARAT